MTIKIGQESLSNTKAVGNFSYIFCIFKLYLIVDIVLGFSKWKCKIKKTMESGSERRITLSLVRLRKSVIVFSTPPTLSVIGTDSTAGPTNN